MEKRIVQITAGQGPAECCLVVARVLEQMTSDAKAQSVKLMVLDAQVGRYKDTFQSVTLEVCASDLNAFVNSWQGSVQWIAQSPYRKLHKRKNWFVGVDFFEYPQPVKWNPKDVVIETCRSSGPGGQNVNKVETAVRGTHSPTGIQVLAMDSRSQLENKKLCLERLQAKIASLQITQLIALQQNLWREHSQLERGNPVRVFERRLR